MPSHDHPAAASESVSPESALPESALPESALPESAFPEPAWVEHAIWWQVYPLGFAGATIFPGEQPGASDGDAPTPATATADSTHPDAFERMTTWLDYVIELGASGLLLGPVFASETHGYDTIDYYRIDPRLGDEDSFRAFVAEARRRGIRILLDGVFNHAGRGFDVFQRALAGSPDSPESRWFSEQDAAPDGSRRFENFEGHDALVALNHDEPAVAEFVEDVMSHWLDTGVDGWRLDVAYAVPTAFWSRVLGRVRETHPDAYFVGEVIHGDYAQIVAESGMNSLTQYETWKAIWNGIEEQNFFELAHALERHNDLLDSFAPLTFIGNHDVTRVASAIADDRHLPHALVVMLTIGGTPSIYYGDEQAFRAVKEEREGGDDAVRPEYPAAGPGELAADGWPTYHLHQELIGVRRRHPWLHHAKSTTIELTNTGFAYELNSEAGADGERLVVALNLADQDFAITIAGTLSVIAGAAEVRESGNGASSSVNVPPHGWAILEG